MSEKEKNTEKPDYKDNDSCANLLKQILDKLTPKYTKFYDIVIEQESLIIIKVLFNNPNYKYPNPQFNCRINFKISRLLNPKFIEFQLENELVYIPLINGSNLEYFQSIIDRIILTKVKSSESLLLHTNFESTRIMTTTGDPLQLYYIEEEDKIFSNNNSEYFNSIFQIEFLPTIEFKLLIIRLWKALRDSETNTMSFHSFCLIFKHGELYYSNEHIEKLWKYSNTTKINSEEDQDNIINSNITYRDFLSFCVDFFQCLKANYISQYKEKNNPFISNRISKAVEIMNMHFKELDYENNSEITFKQLKDCLNKENELFTKNEIEIILNQINPNNKFEYWKFEKILKILYIDYFDYNKLIKEDKIYKYLIKIFSVQDELKELKLHYKAIKYALSIDNKLNMTKLKIIIFLNFFDIVNKPEIDYYSASILLRNVIEELHNPNIAIQKLDILNEKNLTFTNFDDKYDEEYKKIIDIFIKFDEDLDRFLDRNEFLNFVSDINPNLSNKDKEVLFNMTNTSKTGKINFTEFKDAFPKMVLILRVKDVFVDLRKLKILNIDLEGCTINYKIMNSNMKTQSQIIFVKNLPLKISDDDLYDIFWRYGTVIQIRKGINKEKRGSAIIVYENNESAKKAVEELNGFNVAGRFIVCYFYKININNKNKQIEIGI